VWQAIISHPIATLRSVTEFQQKRVLFQLLTSHIQTVAIKTTTTNLLHAWSLQAIALSSTNRPHLIIHLCNSAVPYSTHSFASQTPALASDHQLPNTGPLVSQKTYLPPGHSYMRGRQASHYLSAVPAAVRPWPFVTRSA